MKVTATALISALALGAAAAPAAEPADAAAKQPTDFTGIVSRSGSGIHLQSINANDGHFWIGRPTKSFCPKEEVHDCPPGKVTAFGAGYNRLGMDTEVPGGQSVYIQKNGALSFTEAHSGYIPPGSITTGFTRSPQTSDTPGQLKHGGGFFACNQPGGGHQIYVGVPGFTRTDCLGFGFLTEGYKGVAAWQYD